MMSKRALAALVILFGLAAFYTMPAKLLVSVLGLSNAGVYLQSINGYWHDGGSGMVQINLPGYAIQLEKVRWNLKLSRLFLGQLSADLEGRFAGRDARARVTRSLLGNTSVSGLSLLVDLNDIRPLLNSLIVPLHGSVELRDAALVHNGTWFSATEGEVRVSRLSASVPMGALPIGNFDVHLSQEEGANSPIELTMSNYTGQFGLQGNAQLNSDLTYELAITSEPDGTVQPILLQQMGMIFGPPTQGQYMFEYSAKL